ncbi:unnamed protein product [Closterium sp. NIES-54]
MEPASVQTGQPMQFHLHGHEHAGYFIASAAAIVPPFFSTPLPPAVTIAETDNEALGADGSSERATTCSFLRIAESDQISARADATSESDHVRSASCNTLQPAASRIGQATDKAGLTSLGSGHVDWTRVTASLVGSEVEVKGRGNETRLNLVRGGQEGKEQEVGFEAMCRGRYMDSLSEELNISILDFRPLDVALSLMHNAAVNSTVNDEKSLQDARSGAEKAADHADVDMTRVDVEVVSDDDLDSDSTTPGTGTASAGGAGAAAGADGSCLQSEHGSSSKCVTRGQNLPRKTPGKGGGAGRMRREAVERGGGGWRGGRGGGGGGGSESVWACVNEFVARNPVQVKAQVICCHAMPSGSFHHFPPDKTPEREQKSTQQSSSSAGTKEGKTVDAGGGEGRRENGREEAERGQGGEGGAGEPVPSMVVVLMQVVVDVYVHKDLWYLPARWKGGAATAAVLSHLRSDWPMHPCHQPCSMRRVTCASRCQMCDCGVGMGAGGVGVVGTGMGVLGTSPPPGLPACDVHGCTLHGFLNCSSSFLRSPAEEASSTVIPPAVTPAKVTPADATPHTVTPPPSDSSDFSLSRIFRSLPNRFDAPTIYP